MGGLLGAIISATTIIKTTTTLIKSTTFRMGLRILLKLITMMKLIMRYQPADLVIFSNRESAGPSAPLEKDYLAPIALPDDLKQNLECPVCARISLPPIMQCRNGHVTCNPCRLKVQSCPMCREIDIDIRNLFAEKA